MTREEEIKLAAKKYSKCTTFAAEYDFTQGAEWADEHSKLPWIKVEDDLPCSHEKLINPKDKTETILVLANIGGIVGITKMVKNSHTGEWIWAARATVYYWMPIPELPKE